MTTAGIMVPSLPQTTPSPLTGPSVMRARKRPALSSSTQVLASVRRTSVSQSRARAVTVLMSAQNFSTPGNSGAQKPTTKRPETPPAERARVCTKCSSASNSVSTLLARAPKASPRGVGVTPELVRMKRGSPISFSSSDMALETAWTETPSQAAADEKLPVERIAVTYRSCLMFTRNSPLNNLVALALWIFAYVTI